MKVRDGTWHNIYCANTMIITERANSNNKLKSYVIKEKTLNTEQIPQTDLLRYTNISKT